jgi:hypothetical protein
MVGGHVFLRRIIQQVRSELLRGFVLIPECFAIFNVVCVAIAWICNIKVPYIPIVSV